MLKIYNEYQKYGVQNYYKKFSSKYINPHEDKIKNEKGRLDTSKDYWKKEIDEKFSKQLEEAQDYLEEH